MDLKRAMGKKFPPLIERSGLPLLVKQENCKGASPLFHLISGM